MSDNDDSKLTMSMVTIVTVTVITVMVTITVMGNDKGNDDNLHFHKLAYG